jgi:hypothetical protein
MQFYRIISFWSKLPAMRPSANLFLHLAPDFCFTRQQIERRYNIREVVYKKIQAGLIITALIIFVIAGVAFLLKRRLRLTGAAFFINACKTDNSTYLRYIIFLIIVNCFPVVDSVLLNL